MKTHRIVVALTVINLGLLGYQAVHIQPAEAKTDLTVLRGTGIEIVDDQGRLRASLTILPADKSITLPNGKTLPETVIFRLMTADGKPRVKLHTSDNGSALGLLGATDVTQSLLKADGGDTYLRLKNNDEIQQLIKPKI